jgi:predicted amidohydrolase YtcJ
MLIRAAELHFSEILDLRIAGGRIAAIGQQLWPEAGEEVIEADGGALLPGLRDHHLHLASLAAARASLQCGPPQVHDAAQLGERLREAACERSDEWLRGIGYHESVAGLIDRHWLDRYIPRRPVRIQHRGGRLWIFNSRALELLQAGDGDPLERIDGQLSGRLYDNDSWLRQRLGRQRPDLSEVSRSLASLGVTALTDTSPNNSPEELHWLRQAQQRGELLQDLLLMGDASLDRISEGQAGTAQCPGLAIGPHKFHLHEASLPDYQAVHEAIVASHGVGRNVAFHCVSRTELAFALGVLREAGVVPGDRIEHASITPPEWLAELAALGLTVVTQPGFVAERGEAYLEQVDAADQPWLYRLRGFLDAGIPLAGSSDAPFGDPNPWRAMQAAVTRLTAAGRPLGPDEALGPEQALALFHSPLATPGRNAARIEVGAAADLCLLQAPWARLRHDLAAARPRLTLRGGTVIWRNSAKA